MRERPRLWRTTKPPDPLSDASPGAIGSAAPSRRTPRQPRSVDRSHRSGRRPGNSESGVRLAFCACTRMRIAGASGRGCTGRIDDRAEAGRERLEHRVKPVGAPDQRQRAAPNEQAGGASHPWIEPGPGMRQGAARVGRDAVTGGIVERRVHQHAGGAAGMPVRQGRRREPRPRRQARPRRRGWRAGCGGHSRRQARRARGRSRPASPSARAPAAPARGRRRLRRSRVRPHGRRACRRLPPPAGSRHGRRDGPGAVAAGSSRPPSTASSVKALVSRFRRSYPIAAPSRTNVGTKGTRASI